MTLKWLTSNSNMGGFCANKCYISNRNPGFPISVIYKDVSGNGMCKFTPG